MRRKARGFTLLEVMVVVTILLLLGGLVVWYGRSARQAATLATGAYELALKASGLKARALATGRDHLLVVVDTTDPGGCVYDDRLCGKVLVFSDPQPGFSIAGFNPAPPYSNVAYEEASLLPRNSRFDLASTWRPPVPFNSVTAFDPSLRTTCAGGAACFAIRYRANGEVAPEVPSPPLSPARSGFAFVLRPEQVDSRAAERRGIFVSFPAGVVKTSAF